MRIRTVKPEFWKHAVMAQLPPETQLMALALLNHSDDEGYFEAADRIVRGECMPFRDDLAKLRDDLARLSAVGWIEVRETAEHGPVGRIVKWAEHQRVDHPKKSKLRVYFDASTSREIVATTSRGTPQNSGEEQGIGNREVEQGKEVEVEAPEPPGAPQQPKSAPVWVVKPPTTPPDTWTGEDFWRWAQGRRQAAKLAPEKMPHPRGLSTWWSEVRGHCDAEALKEAFMRFGADPHWEKATPPFPWAGFVHPDQLPKYLPPGAINAASV